MNNTRSAGIDISAMMDRNLNYRENRANIQKISGIQTRNFGMEAIHQKSAEQKAERVRRQDPDRLTGRWQNPHNLLIDQRFQAMRPGKRFSANGRRYYERRSNRADRGKLL
jgi:hypothetical protein